MYVDRAVSKPTLTCGQLEPSLTLPSAPHFYFTGPLPFMKYSLPCHPKSSRPKPSQLPLSPNLVSLCKSPFTLSITPRVSLPVLCACSVASVVSDSLRPHALEPTRLLCPWDFPGKNTGVGHHALLQRIFPTQGSNPPLLHCKWMHSLPLSHQGSPSLCYSWLFFGGEGGYAHDAQGMA